MKRLVIVLSFLILGLSAPVWAQDAFPANAKVGKSATGEPDISDFPVVQAMKQAGVQLHYLGERYGMNGWFLLKENEVQIMYLTSDRRGLVFGAMFSVDGGNLTSQQVASLMERDPVLKAKMESAGRQQVEIAQASGAIPGQASGSAASGAPQNGLPVPTATLSPSEQLMQDVQAAAGVTLGSADNAPLLYMIADPRCPFCKDTWKELRDSVEAGKLRVRLVPLDKTGKQGTENEKLAALFLRTPQPLDVWNKLADGDAAALTGEADATALKAVQNNFAMLEKWKFQYVPFLIYRAKDGQVKLVQGKPERMAAVLTDLVP